MDVGLNTSWTDIVKILISKNTNFWLITTMLLVAYIGISKAYGFCCNLKSEESCKNKSTETECAKLAKKDYTYLVVIVLIVAIFLISLSLYTNENAMSLFSFASTIASIILSVIAIILTITSETKNESTKEKLEKTVEQIEEKTKILEEVSKDINSGLLQEFDQKISHLDQSMQFAITRIEEAVKTTAETKRAVERTRAEGNLEMKDENITYKQISELLTRYKKRGDHDA